MASQHSNSYSHGIGGQQPPLTPYDTMSLKELNTCVDAELLEMTLADIMSLPAEKRTAAIADFAEIDPALGAKLHLAVSFAIS